MSPPKMENQIEKIMEHDMETPDRFEEVYRDYMGFRDRGPIMANQMVKKIEHDMETVFWA